MNESQDAANGWFTRERISTLALGLATLLALYVCYLIVQPFMPALAFALALAVATHRPYRWLQSKFKRETLTAAVGVVLVAILIIGPAAFLITYIVQEAAGYVNELREGANGDWRTALYQQPQLGALLQWAEARFDVEQQVRAIGENLAGRATGFLRSSLGVATQLVITLFVLFFLYRDAKQGRDAVRHLLPLSHGETDRMFARVASTIQATVNGSITVAFVQGVLGGLMYWFLGVPGAALWAGATFITALVPVFGTFLVWGPIATFLALTGSVTKALILAGWGMLAVGSIDNVLYPYLVGDKLRMHTVPTFFAILGGISLFGASGLILGPLALAVTVALLDVWWRRTQHGHAAEEAVTPQDSRPPEAVMQERGTRD